MFRLFWLQVTKEAEKIDIDEPVVPRKRKAPLRFDPGSSSGTSATQPEDHYRVLYFEALDTVTGSITERFDQEGYQIYSKLEQLLLKGEGTEVMIYLGCITMISIRIYSLYSFKHFMLISRLKIA